MTAQIQRPISSKFDMWVRDWEEFFVRDYGPLLDHIKGPFFG
jgi:hypothetical protein